MSYPHAAQKHAEPYSFVGYRARLAVDARALHGASTYATTRVVG
jgi:hypothetical protein